ncbi:MAG: tRNA 4-thiouridine(8) synthase ThiI [Candidatus Delongbacteria bacterium]|nr:tRNA 4-thiouridine(8) synthase ThiI [Candidatus Delongbacteria bacterium]
MNTIFLLKYGELTLKGKNRRDFENKVIRNAKYVLKDHNIEVEKIFGRFVIKTDSVNEEEIKEIGHKLSNYVFGLANVSIGVTVDNELDKINEVALEQAKKYVDKYHPETFKIEVRRPFKNMPGTSTKIAADIGAYVWNALPDLKVKLVDPDMTIMVEILEDFTIISSEKLQCLKGLPVGTSGKVGLLLSGGIDSPVAGYMAQKRGCYLNCIYFHSPPHTPQKTKDKVFALAEKLKQYQQGIRIFTVNFTEIQLMLRKTTDMQYFVLLGRRMMIRISNEIAKRYKFKAFITGENLGQVSSQTIENLHCMNILAKIPILRPLITYDKNETMEIARKIGTYETSILPYDDCCTLFLPPNPRTKAKVRQLEFEEAKLDFQSLVDRAVETVEMVDL